MALDPSSLSLIASGGNGIINTASQLFGSGLQNYTNLELSKYQYSKELDMWNKANEYNTPAAQMQRYKDAGLNPNLIYGQGSSGNTANVLPRYQAPTARADVEPMGNMPNTLSEYQDVRLKDAQIDNVKANAENTRTLQILNAYRGIDQGAKNWFNFGNRDMGKWTNMSDTPSNYYYGQQKLGYSAEVAKSTVNDLINRIRKSVEGTELSNVYRGKMNEYQGSVNKLYNISTGATVLNKILPLLLRLRY
jgi:hypothetical protein